jgi:hypothetical protein
MATAQQDLNEAAQFAADIFGTLLGMQGYAMSFDMRIDHDRTTVTLEILLTPDLR